MIITKTPYRISFFGGGTDYKPYFMKYGGSVISTSIDKYCYLSVRHLPPFFEHRFLAKYSIVEAESDVNKIKHPSIRECLRYTGLQDVSISHDGDLPARAGLGSSSAFTVGLLNGLHAMKSEYRDQLTLAKEAIHVEQDMIQENVGVQDQIAVAVGGLNRIYFNEEGYSVKPIIISSNRKKNLEKNLLLFFTGIVRFASDIAKSQVENTENKIYELKEISDLVADGEKILSSSGNLNEFGRLLDYTWKIKKSLTEKISNSKIDGIYQRAVNSGALGGKILGAGGGGFMLFYVEPDKQENVRKELNELLEVPFEFENEGSRIIHYTMDG